MSKRETNRSVFADKIGNVKTGKYVQITRKSKQGNEV